ncbi:LOW QUALITY PROTEIN: reverse transcriptase [Phytophthora megakarya]|uniref:Reverse transcriptase n=1 Tax=Phytophthora megakarya TaxID=4795 RepID=A0A225VNF4_9STRA|nr:LOW QUALITY PROTEIN: reverse transcriptase [Phytophthora megakarya]
MKGPEDGPVKTYLFREYPSTAKLHVNVPLPPEPAVEVADKVQNQWTFQVQLLRGSRGREPTCDASGAETSDIMHASVRHQYTRSKVDVAIQGISSRANKQRDGSVGAGRPTGIAVTRVYNGHAVLRIAAPSEKESHCKVQDSMPNLIILKAKSMTKRADSLREFADSDVSSNLFDSNSVGSTIATGATVKTEKRVIRARFSYKHRGFVEELLVLDLDNKFDMVLGMPWLARHDPIIDWEKRTVVRFGYRGATESDGPVSVADTLNSASEPPSETVARAAVSSRSAWSPRAVTTPGVVDRKGVSGQGPDPTKKLSAVRRRGDNSVSTLGVDTHSISKSREFPAVRR